MDSIKPPKNAKSSELFYRAYEDIKLGDKFKINEAECEVVGFLELSGKPWMVYLNIDGDSFRFPNHYKSVLSDAKPSNLSSSA